MLQSGLPVDLRIVDFFDRPQGCLFSPRCTLADDRCRTQEPPVQGRDLGFARCHYPIPTPGQEVAQ